LGYGDDADVDADVDDAGDEMEDVSECEW